MRDLDTGVLLDNDFTQATGGGTGQTASNQSQISLPSDISPVGQNVITAPSEAAARNAISAAQSGANADISSLSNLTGDVIFSAVGAALEIKEGANAFMGAATLVAGTVTVGNTRVTANSRIFLSNQNGAGVVGAPYVSARVAGTSFTITSTSAADTSSVAWLIVEPA